MNCGHIINFCPWFSISAGKSTAAVRMWVMPIASSQHSSGDDPSAGDDHHGGEFPAELGQQPLNEAVHILP